MPRAIVLDANVLFGAFIRDCILSTISTIAAGSISLHWSPHIQREWVGHLKVLHPDRLEAIDETVKQMNRAFPRAMVRGDRVDNEIRGLKIVLPDSDDLHVVACALATSAECIVTQTTKDFPANILETIGLHTLTADAFLLDLLMKEPITTVIGIARMRARYRNPPRTPKDLIDRMRQVGLNTFADALNQHHIADL